MTEPLHPIELSAADQAMVRLQKKMDQLVFSSIMLPGEMVGPSSPEFWIGACNASTCASSVAGVTIDDLREAFRLLRPVLDPHFRGSDWFEGGEDVFAMESDKLLRPLEERAGL